MTLFISKSSLPFHPDPISGFTTYFLGTGRAEGRRGQLKLESDEEVHWFPITVALEGFMGAWVCNTRNMSLGVGLILSLYGCPNRASVTVLLIKGEREETLQCLHVFRHSLQQA
jgi:hypothetical protein